MRAIIAAALCLGLAGCQAPPTADFRSADGKETAQCVEDIDLVYDAGVLRMGL
jgi:hypothetical protein